MGEAFLLVLVECKPGLFNWVPLTNGKLLFLGLTSGVWRSGSAPVLGTGGPRFDPEHPDH